MVMGDKSPNNHHRSQFVLGIDLGTTSIKACLVDTATSKVLHSLTRETKANLINENNGQSSVNSEQDVHRICIALQFCVSRLPKELLSRVVKIGVSGQMHGVVLWKHSEGWRQNQFGRYETENVSSLYTWQDGRCTKEFLATLPKPNSHLRVSSGHGCATVFWLNRNRVEGEEVKYDRMGTIQDFIVAMLCQLDWPAMSEQNAASWGYFDTVAKKWNTDILRDADFPVHMLPDILEAGKTAGRLHSSWYGIPEGTPVAVALGDMQCSVMSTLENDSDAVMSVSTSAQLSFILPVGFKPPSCPEDSLFPPTIEFFPYFNNRYLAVAASLNGGNVLATFVKMLQQWTHDFGLGVPEDKIWERIMREADEEDASADVDLCIIKPTCFGERHDPDSRGSITNISPYNTSLGKMFRALCRGVITNVHDMMSRDRLMESGIERILGSGCALARNKVLCQEVKRAYRLPLQCSEVTTDAAIGAAMAVLNCSNFDY